MSESLCIQRSKRIVSKSVVYDLVVSVSTPYLIRIELFIAILLKRFLRV